MSPVSAADKTVSQVVSTADASMIQRFTSALSHPEPWQRLVGQSHWFSDRRLKLVLTNRQGQVLPLWVEFFIRREVGVARFDRLPDATADRPAVPMSDAGSRGLSSAIELLMETNGVEWVSTTGAQ